MTFVTKLRFQSGDRALLDDVVGDLHEWIERKGAECKGPHAESPRTVQVPRYRRLQPGETTDPWSYTVYARSMEIHGSDWVAREVGSREYPDAIHLEVEIERKKPLGYRKD
jgi:ribosomal protein S10